MDNKNNIKNLWIIWYCVFLHFIWGLSLLITNESIHTTTIDAFFFFSTNVKIIGSCLCSIAILASCGLFNHKWPKWIDCLMVLPQQFILLLSANGAITAIIHSQFADGVQRSRTFIFCDQLDSILLAIFHTATIIYYWGGNYIKEFFKVE